MVVVVDEFGTTDCLSGFREKNIKFFTPLDNVTD